jgi:hypothetical protein
MKTSYGALPEMPVPDMPAMSALERLSVRNTMTAVVDAAVASHFTTMALHF